jgi:hypothetical protein
MATARTPANADPPADDGFNDTQKSQLSEMIAAAVGGAKPPPTTDAPKGPKPVSDDEWDNMSDRNRESWVRQLVDAELDRLVKDDEDRKLRDTVAELAGLVSAKPEPEKIPGPLARLQVLFWGRPDDKA